MVKLLENLDSRWVDFRHLQAPLLVIAAIGPILFGVGGPRAAFEAPVAKRVCSPVPYFFEP